jgi:murein DD-endopeptidase MepM/ murein hydrolase activator NlpD
MGTVREDKKILRLGGLVIACCIGLNAVAWAAPSGNKLLPKAKPSHESAINMQTGMVGRRRGAGSSRTDAVSEYSLDTQSSGEGAPGQLISPDVHGIAALKPPLLSTRITSSFGWRINPVFKRRMFHRGTDYGAPDGTPVHAAQDGEIEMMEGHQNFGFYVRMRHGHSLETAYGHLLKFMPGLHRGSFVRCGDIIGFVGATGMATGPHLHYEVLVGGQPIDPEGLLSISAQRVAALR